MSDTTRSAKNKYSVPLICSDEGCVMDLSRLTRNGRKNGDDMNIDLNPGDVLEFKLDKSAGPYAIVVVLEEELVTKASRCLRVKKGQPQSIKVWRRPQGDEPVSLSFLIYSPACGCSYPQEDIFESFGGGFSVDPRRRKKKKPPRPRKKKRTKARSAGRGRRG